MRVVTHNWGTSHCYFFYFYLNISCLLNDEINKKLKQNDKEKMLFMLGGLCFSGEVFFSVFVLNIQIFASLTLHVSLIPVPVGLGAHTEMSIFTVKITVTLQ